jgi:hypothetical protein
MRTHVTRVAPVLYASVLVVAVAAFALSILGQHPTGPLGHNGRVPDVQCPAGVTPAQSFCYVTAPPNASKVPDTSVPPDPSKAP